jgi:hypothetical protein
MSRTSIRATRCSNHFRRLQPAPGGYVDAFVAKLAPDGSRLLYSTFLGGTGVDRASGIAVDANGAATITGGAYEDTRPT